ncbi:hypothetical protein B0H67DRAFT_679889 [Lasiosphaeris hirsuta]|uniref:Uncharacterized protein n=1 Tax=Lasiosphaeris hirsuta TaxID=260670 RepID=A0AA40AYB6_9PEZI|nr:hypothetical protein B0H67DRAFT_679889 [Lasiosphaeris hirsuta]
MCVLPVSVLFSFLAFSAQGALANTVFAGSLDDSTSSSVQSAPCHLIGDPDLYEISVRCAFYLSFFTCLVDFLLSLVDKSRNPRLSFNILFLANVITLIWQVPVARLPSNSKSLICNVRSTVEITISPKAVIAAVINATTP